MLQDTRNSSASYVSEREMLRRSLSGESHPQLTSGIPRHVVFFAAQKARFVFKFTWFGDAMPVQFAVTIGYREAVTMTASLYQELNAISMKLLVP